MAKTSLLFVSVFVIATCGLGYELIAGTVASYLLGDSITQFSTAIGLYLFALGIGAYLSRFIDRHLCARFIDVELAVALLGTVVLLGSAAPRAAAGERLAALHRALYRWALRLAGGGAAARRARPPLLRVPRFPLLLTISVLLRVALTVAALRLLLSRGEAGWVIDGVTALAGQDPRVALALLLLCGAAQYLVLARGGERAAEVAARFALDALPGRQAAIEADLRAGALLLRRAARMLAARGVVPKELVPVGITELTKKSAGSDKSKTSVVLGLGQSIVCGGGERYPQSPVTQVWIVDADTVARAARCFEQPWPS